MTGTYVELFCISDKYFPITCLVDNPIDPYNPTHLQCARLCRGLLIVSVFNTSDVSRIYRLVAELCQFSTFQVLEDAFAGTSLKGVVVDRA